jgi:membrane-associated phospholipid phosphatase
VATTLLALVEFGGLDPSLFRLFNALSLHTGPGLWANLTILGDGLVVAVLFLPWVHRHPERVWAGVLGALIMVVILRLFKELLPLPRPLGVLPEDTLELIGPGHRRSAFPSGHTSSAFLLAGVWALSSSRRWLAPALLVYASLAGISRMAVGVHWPSDVLGGAILGWGSAWVGLRLAGRWNWGEGPAGRRVLGTALMASAVVLLAFYPTGYPGVLLLQRALALVCLTAGGRGLLRELRESGYGGFPRTGVRN